MVLGHTCSPLLAGQQNVVAVTTRHIPQCVYIYVQRAFPVDLFIRVYVWVNSCVGFVRATAFFRV